MHKILASQHEIRRKPFTDKLNGFNAVEQVAFVSPLSTVASVLPWNMCPDGSYGLLKKGKAVLCGTGIDGFNLCPIGYYCSIESEQNSKLIFF